MIIKILIPIFNDDDDTILYGACLWCWLYKARSHDTIQQTYTLYNLHPIALTYTQQSDSQRTEVHALERASMACAIQHRN